MCKDKRSSQLALKGGCVFVYMLGMGGRGTFTWCPIVSRRPEMQELGGDTRAGPAALRARGAQHWGNVPSTLCPFLVAVNSLTLIRITTTTMAAVTLSAHRHKPLC